MLKLGLCHHLWTHWTNKYCFWGRKYDQFFKIFESEKMCKKRIYEMVHAWVDTDKKWRKHSLLSKTDSTAYILYTI